MLRYLIFTPTQPYTQTCLHPHPLFFLDASLYSIVFGLVMEHLLVLACRCWHVSCSSPHR